LRLALARFPSGASEIHRIVADRMIFCCLNAYRFAAPEKGLLFVNSGARFLSCTPTNVWFAAKACDSLKAELSGNQGLVKDLFALHHTSSA